MAAYGFSGAYSLDIGVRVYGFEILAILVLFLGYWRGLFSTYPMLRTILSTYALWAVAIVIADLVNQTAFIDSARHLATPVLGGLYLISVLSIIHKRPRSVLTALIAAAVGKAVLGDAGYQQDMALGSLTFEQIQADTNLFKTRVEPFLSPLMIFTAWIIGRRSARNAAMVFLMTALLYLFFDTRSTALIFLLSGLTLLYFTKQRHLSARKVLSRSALILLLSYPLFLGYTEYTLRFKPDGHHGKQLQAVDNPYNPFDVLAVGRSEWLVMPKAIAERPIFGWGSWAEDRTLYFQALRYELLRDQTFKPSQEIGKYYIPAHSLIGAAWLWSGILGFIAMIWFLRIVLRMTLQLIKTRSDLLPIAIIGIYGIFWSFFFSPPMVMRLGYAGTLALLLVLTREFFQKRSSSTYSTSQDAPSTRLEK
jgi:hypothetical protein